MSLIGLIVAIAVLGLIVWAITTLIPMPEPFKRAIYVVAVVILVLYVLAAFGLLASLDMRVPQVR
jgi:sulfite exporter TauE/SafE